jgi:hypothetical protein
MMSHIFILFMATTSQGIQEIAFRDINPGHKFVTQSDNYNLIQPIRYLYISLNISQIEIILRYEKPDYANAPSYSIVCGRAEKVLVFAVVTAHVCIMLSVSYLAAFVPSHNPDVSQALALLTDPGKPRKIVHTVA